MDRFRFYILFLVQIFCFCAFVISFADKDLLGVCFYGILNLSLESETSRLVKEIEGE